MLQVPAIQTLGNTCTGTYGLSKWLSVSLSLHVSCMQSLVHAAQVGVLGLVVLDVDQKHQNMILGYWERQSFVANLHFTTLSIGCKIKASFFLFSLFKAGEGWDMRSGEGGGGTESKTRLQKRLLLKVISYQYYFEHKVNL